MNNVFINPEDLKEALLETVNPGPVMVPTMKDQLRELVQPGRELHLRTESGSIYVMSIYMDMTVVLNKVDEETDGIREVAKGELTGAYDSTRDVCGIVIEEPSGREYKTSAVVKAWLAYDAMANRSYSEPI